MPVVSGNRHRESCNRGFVFSLASEWPLDADLERPNGLPLVHMHWNAITVQHAANNAANLCGPWIVVAGKRRASGRGQSGAGLSDAVRTRDSSSLLQPHAPTTPTQILRFIQPVSATSSDRSLTNLRSLVYPKDELANINNFAAFRLAPAFQQPAALQNHVKSTTRLSHLSFPAMRANPIGTHKRPRAPHG